MERFVAELVTARPFSLPKLDVITVAVSSSWFCRFSTGSSVMPSL